MRMHTGKGTKNAGKLVVCQAEGKCPNGGPESHVNVGTPEEAESHNRFVDAYKDTGIDLSYISERKRWQDGDQTPKLEVMTGKEADKLLETAYKVSSMSDKKKEWYKENKPNSLEARVIRIDESNNRSMRTYARIAHDHDEEGRLLAREDKHMMDAIRNAKTVMVDLDGCVGNFSHIMQDTAEERFGADLNGVDPDPNSYDMFNATNGWKQKAKGLSFYPIFENGISEGRFVDEPVDRQAVEVLNKLQASGKNIVIVTARGFRNLEGTDKDWIDRRAKDDTLIWLRRMGLHTDSVVFSADKSAVDADVYIDDAPANVNNLHAEGKTVFMIPHKYNRDVDCPVIMDWNELLPDDNGSGNAEPVTINRRTSESNGNSHEHEAHTEQANHNSRKPMSLKHTRTVKEKPLY